MQVANLSLFAVTVISVIAAFINYNKCKNSDGVLEERPLFKLSDRSYLILLAVITAVGVAIRLWQFGSVPGGFNQDGAMAAVDGKALADYATDRFGTHMPAHLYAWGYGQMSSLLSYMIAVFTKLFGFSEITARLPQVIMSIIGGGFFYLFIKNLFGKNTALVAALVVAVNPWHLVQSRWALDCNLLPHFFIGGLYFLSNGLVGKKGHIYISMVFFALCMYCYGIAIYTIPLFLLVASIYYYRKKAIAVREIIISAIIYLAISWPFILTMAINFFKIETIELPFVTIQLFSDSVRKSDILFFSDDVYNQLILNIKSLLSTTIMQKKDLPWNDIKGFGTMFLFSMPFFIAGIFELKRLTNAKNKELVFFAILTGVWVGLVTNSVNVNRVNIIYYGIMMFVVLGISFVIRYFDFGKTTVFFSYIFAGVLLVSTYFGDYADEIKNQFYFGFKQAYNTVKMAETDKLYITADAQGKGYWNVSEILTLFYDKTDALYFQGKTNENNGKEYLPYRERFSYVSMDESVIQRSKDEDAAYLILKTDIGLFDEESYNITEYGRFCAVVKK